MLLNQMGVLGDSFWQQDVEGWESGELLELWAAERRGWQPEEQLRQWEEKETFMGRSLSKVHNISLCYLYIKSHLLNYILFFSNHMSGP